MTAHSLLGASGAHRWLNCPGSFALSQQLPHRPPSIYAATGSLAHTLIEACWRHTAEADVSQLGQYNDQETGHTITVDQDFIDGVNIMLHYIRSIDRGLTEVEVQVSLDHYFPGSPPPVPLFGTVDVRAIDPDTDTLEIVDYKNGAGVPVSPVENPQLLYYAAGSITPAMWDKLKLIKLTIVQPHAPGPPIKTWEIAPVDLSMWIGDVLIPGVDLCATPDAPLNPGSWCRFCPVAHGCPRLHQDAVEMAKRDFADIPNDGENLAVALDTAARAEIWINALRDRALDQLRQEIPIPGWELVPTRPTRQWTQDEDTIEDALAKLGVTRAAVLETRLRSPAQLEKQLARTSAGRRQWTDITRQGLVAARSSGVKLGRTTTAAEEFADE
jgi:hypothetical protein